MDLVNWALRTSPKFTTGIKDQSFRVFDQIRDPEIPITLRHHNKNHAINALLLEENIPVLLLLLDEQRGEMQIKTENSEAKVCL